MPERRQAASSSSASRVPGVRRNLFRRTETGSASTSDIVIRDSNGEFEIEDPPLQPYDEQEEGGRLDAQEDEKERQRLAEAVKHHQRDRNRAPSEPAELLEAVRASLRQKTIALADDNWKFEAEEDPVLR